MDPFPTGIYPRCCLQFGVIYNRMSVILTSVRPILNAFTTLVRAAVLILGHRCLQIPRRSIPPLVMVAIPYLISY